MKHILTPIPVYRNKHRNVIKRITTVPTQTRRSFGPPRACRLGAEGSPPATAFFIIGLLLIFTTDMNNRIGQTLIKRVGTTPVSTYNIMTPGVSGHQTTGVTGNFGFQIHRPIEVISNVDPSTSGFGLQNHIPQVSTGRFTMAQNVPNTEYISPLPNVNSNIVTPTVTLDQSATLLQSSLGLSRDLQAGLEPRTGSYLNEILYQGGYQEDPLVSRLFRDDLEPTIGVPGEFITPVDSRHTPVGPTAGLRQNDMSGYGTINPTYNIQIQGVDTEQADYALHRLQQHTPSLMNRSNATPATHGSHAQGIGPGTPNVSAASFNLQGTVSQMQPNPYPYLDLGMPPQPMELLPGATGQLTNKAAAAMRSVPGAPIQFEL